jgi:nucleoside-diphosphate-sugar epimerase
MVIGNGLISNSFIEYSSNKDYLIFASGVSDSNEIRNSEFKREFDLISENINKDGKFIYFSTINGGDSKYFTHKKSMENFIISNSKNYLIFRLPNVVGYGGNINNIFNYFNSKILNGDVVNIQNVTRSLIDIDDVRRICKYCLNLSNKVINISNIEILKVSDIVDTISDEININVKKK